MAEEIDPPPQAMEAPKKRKFKNNKLSKTKKKMKKGMEASHRETSRTKVRNTKKMRKLFERRAKEYNSDDDEDNEKSAPEVRDPNSMALDPIGNYSEGEGTSDLDGRDVEEEEEEERGGSEDEGDEIQPGITKFVEGCRAFRVAFLKIMKKNVSNDLLGPVLSGHKKLIAEKLAEEEAEHNVKREAKKEKLLVAEKGHVKPASFLDTKEKFLVSVATKGVVKLFNAVNKAQNAQKGLNPSTFKDAKALGKRRKEAFFAELRKTSDNTSINATKGSKSTHSENNDEPSWAPLRDSFMLANSKLKDWDKMPDPAASVVSDEILPLEDSSDDDE